MCDIIMRLVPIVHDLLFFLALLLSSMPLLIYWCTWYFLPKHACMYWISWDWIWAIPWNSQYHWVLILSLEYPQFFLFQKDWDGSQVKPHRMVLFGEPFHFDQNLFLRSLWVSFFQAETCRFMKISSRPCFLSLWEYCTVFLTLWVALYRADLNDPLKGGIYV